MSGFQDASITKGMMIGLTINSLAASLLDIKPYLHLQLVPHMTKYSQYWRVLIHPFAFANSTELLMGLLVLYQVGVVIERSFGPRKYASFILLSSILSTLLSSAVILLFHRFGLNAIPAGPYGVIFSLIWQHYRTVPSLYVFRILGIEFSSRFFTYILAAQLFLSAPPSSILASFSGLFTGYLYRTDTLIRFPFSRRRGTRPLKAYRIPRSIHTLLARMFEPIIGTSIPPRRSTRVLPGQVSESSARVTATDQAPRASLRSLIAQRMGAPPPPPPPLARLPNGTGTGTGTIPQSTSSPALPAVSAPVATGARAAVGEFVSTMTGRGQGGARAPTEEEISTLLNMFPNAGREAVVRALQRSDGNTAQAVESLLEGS